MNVLYHDVFRQSPEREEELVVRYVEFDELVESADFISLLAPLTAETKHIVNADVLGRMQPHAILVNTARGPLVDEAALAVALDRGDIRGAALDVYEHEPEVNERLRNCRGSTVLLPHIGSATMRTRVEMCRMALTDAGRVLNGDKHGIRSPHALDEHHQERKTTMQTMKVYPEFPMCDPEIIERLKALSTTVISDSMERVNGLRGIAAIAMTPYQFAQPMVGQAFTVRTAAGDNLAMHQAMEIVGAGQVLAVAAGGDTERAITGEIMTQYAASLGVAGLVVDGAVRDSDTLRQRDFPVFAAGVNHLGPYKNGPGAIRCTVSMGGVVVHPGDILVGDADGVAVIPIGQAAAILKRSEAKEAEEREIMRQIPTGEYPTVWLKDLVTLEHVESFNNGSPGHVADSNTR